MKSIKKKKVEEVKVPTSRPEASGVRDSDQSVGKVKKEEHKPIHIDAKTHEIKEEKAPEVESIPVADVRVEEKNSFLLQIAIPVVIGVIAGVVTGTGVFSVLNMRSQKNTQTPSPTPTVAAVSEDKEASQSGKMLEEDLTLYDIKVLNGSGKGGEAGKLEKILKDKGFSVLEIGNADKSDYEKTVVQVKTKVPQSYLTKLMDLLGESLDVDKKQELDESEDVDVIIIVGSSGKSTSSSTPTPKEE